MTISRRTLLLGGAGTIGLMALGLYVAQRQSASSGLSLAAVADEVTASAVGEAGALPDMVLGAADAKVTIIEYGSFTCPHCAHFHETVYPELKKNYIDTGKVKFMFREVYFDKFGLWAAMVARCGGTEKYFPIADMIYDTQKDWLGGGEPGVIGENLRKIGLKAGLSKEALETCLADNEQAKLMVATYQKNATADAIEGTPTFIINGEKFSNMSYEDLAKILDAKLAG